MSQSFEFKNGAPPRREALLDPEKKHLFVFAHQDDELPYAGLLRRLRQNAEFIWVTNGDGLAPGVGEDPPAYAEKRIAECASVMRTLGVAPARYRCLGYSEIEIYDRFTDFARGRELGPAWQLFERMASAVEQAVREILPDVVWTVAYQGGHPEHDLTHLLTARALRRLRYEGNMGADAGKEKKISLVQLPEYEFTILVPLRFRPGYRGPIYQIVLDDDELEFKDRVRECYPSQVELIKKFEQVIGALGKAARLVGREFTFEQYARREQFGPVPPDFDYLAFPHALEFFTYMFERHNGVPVTFGRCIRPLAFQLLDRPIS